jgi:hypothetical protein
MGGKWQKGGLLAGIICFGFILPDSLSDHTKLVHFAAHMGMSFLVASFSYVIFNLVFRLNKSTSMGLLILITLIVGGIYKYWEITATGRAGDYSLGPLLKVTGCYTSMSQNTSGLLAAILLIELIFSRVRALHHAPAPGSLLLMAAAPSRLPRRQKDNPRA